MLLERCTGPECPTCGCQDVREFDRNERSGWLHVDGQRVAVRSVSRRLICGHCGRQWTLSTPYEETRSKERGAKGEEEMGPDPARGDAVAFYPVRCPRCKSTNNIVTSSKIPMRYHKCRDCDHTFKSVERRER